MEAVHRTLFPCMKTLLINGHPRPGSFCHALADDYAAGARESGSELRRLNLGELDFNLNVDVQHPQLQEREADILRSIEWVKWADHLVFVYPVWWGTMPALLKGFLDRVFLPGFAFYQPVPGDYRGLLQGRTAQLILALDTPVFVFKAFIKAPAVNALKVATLNLCGIGPVKTKLCSPVSHSTPEMRKRWLQETRQLGFDSTAGVATGWDRFLRKVIPWLKAVRIQFYPMTLVAFLAGSFAAVHAGGAFSWMKFIISYLIVFLMEMLAVFINELEDFAADVQNKAYGPFNGGSRVLVNNELTPRQMAKGMYWQVAGIAVFSGLSIFYAGANALPLYVAIVATLFLAVGYTMRPIKFSYRTLGEITVALSHSFAVILIAFLAQGGSPHSPLPWLLGLPLFVSILPSITLGNVPDQKADKQVGKKTFAVRFGLNHAALFALVTTWIAAALAIWVYFQDSRIYSPVIFFIIPHGLWLSYELIKYRRLKEKPETINSLMILSLTYMMWFALVPVFNL